MFLEIKKLPNHLSGFSFYLQHEFARINNFIIALYYFILYGFLCVCTA